MRSEIQSENLILRRYEMAFAPFLFEAAFESRGGEFSRWMPWCHADYKIEESREFIEKVVKKWETAEIFAYAVFDAQTNKFLGGVGLNQPNNIHKFYNLGYWVRTSAQNRGTASEATRALAQAAFEDLPINRLEVIAVAENVPSRKTAEKAGAKFEGILRKRLSVGGRIHDAAMFSFVREDLKN